MQDEKYADEICECGGRFNRFVEPRLLLLLREKKSYGYELLEKLNEFSFPGGTLDTATVYRTLRNMEAEGLVKSAWATGESGPPKRMYEITMDGEDRLHSWVMSFEDRKQAIEAFIKRYHRKKASKSK